MEGARDDRQAADVSEWEAGEPMVATAATDDPTRVTVVSASDLGGTTKVVTDPGGTPITTARPGKGGRP